MATNIPPQDIILEILLRLPVKSILRFRIISKSWLRSISNPSFALSYQNRARSTRNYILNGEGYLCKFSLDDTRRLEDLYFPCDPMVRVVGVCNGIVCLGLASLVILWNPATRKYRDAHCPEVYAHLPNVEGTEGRVCISRHSYGYGMDLSRREYVYLWIYCRRWDSTLHSVVRVYSAREDSWKVLEGDFRFQLTEYKNCAVVKGVPYWTAIVRRVEEEDKLSEVLVAFDVRNEVFKVVEYPEAAFKRGNRAYFVEFNEHLASLVYCPGEQGSQLVDVWVLDDGECWSKKFTVGPILMEIERLVGCSGDGDIMGLDTEHGLFLFLSRNKEIDYIYTNDGNYGDIDVHNYYETLVSVDGMKFIDKEE